MTESVMEKTKVEPADSGEECGGRSDVQSRISCPCGFEVVGFDEDNNRFAFQNHPCPNRPVEEPEPWYGYVFSFWGFVILAIIAWTIVFAFGGAR
jgi:hypothetical protein